MTNRLVQFRRDNTYLLPSLPIAIGSFTAVVTAIAVSVGLLPIVVGLPLLALSLLVARGFASVERLRLRALGMPVPAPERVAVRAGWRGSLDAIRDKRAWLDALHAIVTFPTAIIAWSLTIAWWAGALGGLSYPLWRWALPDGSDDQNLAELIGIDSSTGEIALTVGIGLAFALTIVPVIRGLAGGQSGLSRAVLAPEQVGTPGPQ
ncbi:sensor domain-containing protein [Nocardioidaceae bacterium SCSIO 66511]|nr:sensor domain-containing protein [Nocardioidaceae bacterium SCSIO 66511]